MKATASRPQHDSKKMCALSQFQNAEVRYLFTDIDDTLTDEGQLHEYAYEALWNLQRAQIMVIPVTGRPAGWCEMIARMWPVGGVVGENGAFYFRYHDKKMLRHFVVDENTRLANRSKLDKLAETVLEKVKGTALASDQFSRLMDVAIDFCEDVPRLPMTEVQKIVRLFEENGATAKISSIHVNAWFGKYDKLSMCKTFAQTELGIDLEHHQKQFAFSGDSPNDEPMFSFFENSFAVANIKNFEAQLKDKPRFVAHSIGGRGFVEIAEALLKK